MTLMSDLIKNTSPSTFKKGEALFKQGKFNPENYIKVDDGNIHKYYNSYAGHEQVKSSISSSFIINA